MTFLFLLLFGSFLALLGKIFKPETISWRETALHVFAAAIIAGVSAAVVYRQNVDDVEIWNGRVVKKEMNEVSCEHFHSCNCKQKCSGSGKNRSCREECEKCPDHRADYDWIITTSNHEKIEIDREDRQGKIEPTRYSRVKIGEPTAREHHYKNYLLANPDSVLQLQISEAERQKYQDVIPVHPNVFDYYRSTQFLPVQINSFVSGEWNQKLSQINADLGARKQVNIIIIVTSLPSDFFRVLRAEWKGGKKNDVVVVIGTQENFSPRWVETMAWSVDGGFGTRMRQAIMDLSSVNDSANVLPVIASVVEKHYQRKPMKDLEYLAESIQPSTSQWVGCGLIMLLCSLGLIRFFHRESVFGDEKPKHYFKFSKRQW